MSGQPSMQQICNNPLIVQPVRPLPGRVAVIGAGTIGPDIGYYLKGAIADLELVLIDLSQDALDRASARIRSYADKGLARGKLTADAAARTTARITTSTDYAAIRGSDWVIEAATENLPVKRAIFTEVESLVAADALITSNTSSLPAARLFSHLQHPERATVTHFFAPAFRNPIVEVIDWPVLDRERLQHLRWLFATTGKVPLVAADAVCFMLDRIFDNWCNEAGHLLADATAEEIDSAAQEFVAAGPFFVLNLANGNPIIVETNDLQAEVEGQHYRPAAVFRSVERWKTVPPGRRVEVPAAKRALIRDRLLGILFSQSLDILDRRIGTAADLELGSRLAFGFKSGPLELMKAEPAPEVERILQRLRRERAGMPGPAEALQHYQRFRRHVLVDDLEGVKVLTDASARGAQCAARRAQRRVARRHPRVRGRSRDPRLRHHRVWPPGVLRRRRHRPIPVAARRCGCRERNTRAPARGCWSTSMRCANPSSPRLTAWRSAAGWSLRSVVTGSSAVRAAWLQLPESHARHRPGYRCDGRTVSPLAAGVAGVSRHASRSEEIERGAGARARHACRGGRCTVSN